MCTSGLGQWGSHPGGTTNTMENTKPMSATEYTDITQLQSLGENLPADFVPETEDFDNRPLEPVGLYLSPSRKIEAKTRDDGHIVFAITFEGGLQALNNGGSFYFQRFPLRTWISTVPYTPSGGRGQTTSAAEYLRACGFNPRGMNAQAFIDAILASISTPVQVYVGLEEKGNKDEATGKWITREPKLKTKDFNLGTKEEPNYVRTVTLPDGYVASARHVAKGFRKIAE